MRAATVEGYLKGVGGPQRAALEKLRRTIRAAVPKAEECISYGIPAFRLGDEVIAGFAVRGTGCSYYPFSGSTLRTLREEVSGYSQTKSALHFEAAKGLPASLVRKLLRARIAETR